MPCLGDCIDLDGLGEVGPQVGPHDVPSPNLIREYAEKSDLHPRIIQLITQFMTSEANSVSVWDQVRQDSTGTFWVPLCNSKALAPSGAGTAFWHRAVAYATGHESATEITKEYIQQNFPPAEMKRLIDRVRMAWRMMVLDTPFDISKPCQLSIGEKANKAATSSGLWILGAGLVALYLYTKESEVAT